MLREDPPTPPDALPRRRAPRHRAGTQSLGGLVAGAAVLASAAGILLWLHLLAGPLRLATGLLDASRHLEKAEKRLSAGNMDAARFEAVAAGAAAARSDAALGSASPLLDVLARVPEVGPALDEVDHLIAAARHSTTAARGSVEIAANAIEGPDSIIERGGKGGDSRIKLERVVEIGEEVGDLRAEIDAAQRELAAIDLDNLPRRASNSINEATRKAKEAEAALVDAAAAFEILPGVLGADGPRTYLIAFQNSAEERGTGGAILQFVLMNVNDGRLSLEEDEDKTGSIYAVDEKRQQIDIPLPEDAWYQRGIPDARRFGNANWSPDFPLATELLLSYAYASEPTFPQVDGVIAIDPKVIEDLVPAVGPIKVPGGGTLGTKEVVNYVLNGQYGRFPDPRERRAHLRVLVDRFYGDIFDPKSPSKLLSGLSGSLSEKRMQIWMREKEEQNFIKRMDWDGAIQKKKGADYLYLVEQNVGGNKFDYFDTHENEVDITLEGDTATTSTSMAVTHRAVLPQAEWVMGDSGTAEQPVHRPMMVMYTHADADLVGASIEGTRVDTPAPAIWSGGVTPPSYLERGRRAWPVTMEALPQETVTAHLEYRVPGIVRSENGRKVYRLVVQHQPKVRPEWLDLTVHLPAGARDIRSEGWKRPEGGGLAWTGEVKRDMTLEVSWRN